MASHINYLGDLLLALAYSLPCGFSRFGPYFYPFNLLVLLGCLEACGGLQAES